MGSLTLMDNLVIARQIVDLPKQSTNQKIDGCFTSFANLLDCHDFALRKISQ